MRPFGLRNGDWELTDCEYFNYSCAIHLEYTNHRTKKVIVKKVRGHGSRDKLSLKLANRYGLKAQFNNPSWGEATLTDKFKEVPQDSEDDIFDRLDNSISCIIEQRDQALQKVKELEDQVAKLTKESLDKNSQIEFYDNMVENLKEFLMPAIDEDPHQEEG